MAMQTINACFSSRREADLALEHLTQEHGVERTDIFVQSATDENTAGTEVAGADAAAGDPGTDRRDDSALHGRVELSIDISDDQRSEEHTSELQSLMRISYAVFCLKKKTENLHI